MAAWYIASALAGVSLGLYFGRLMAALILNWESSATAVRTWMAVVAFVFGGGALGSTAIFQLIASADYGAYYLGGWGLGAIFTFFQPRMPVRNTLDQVRIVLEMSDELEADLPDIEMRSVLIGATLAPPKSVEKGAHMSEEEYARALERAADMVAFKEGRRDG